MRRILAVVLLVAVAVAVAWWFARPPRAEDRLADLVAELRARGEPVSLLEMEAPLPPDDRNGALDLDAATAWFDAHEPDDDWESRVAGPWNRIHAHPYEEHATSDQLDELRDFLAFLQPFFEHVDRAASKPEIAWPLAPGDSAASALARDGGLQTLHRISQFLNTRAASAATAEERVAGIRALLAIGARLRTRDAVGGLTAATLHSFGARRLRAGLEGERIDPAQARARLDDVLSTEWDARFSRMVRGTRATYLDSIPFWLDGTLQKELEVGGLFVGFDPDREQSGRRLLEGVRLLGAYVDDPRSAHDVFRQQPDPAIDANSMTFIVPRLRGKLVATDAAARLARVALAAYAYRRVHDHWPESPAELSPQFPDGVPTDPFTGAPFTFQRDGDTLVLRAQPWEDLVEGGEDARDHEFVWRLPAR